MVPPVLVCADEKHLNTSLTAIKVQCNNIRLRHTLWINTLCRLHLGQRFDPVAQRGGTFKFQLFGRGRHFRGKARLDRCRLSVQKVLGILDRLAIVVRTDFPHTWRRAAFDLKLQTRARSAVKSGVRTVPQQKHALQLVQRSVYSASTSERAVIVTLFFLGTTVFFQLREIVFRRHQNIWKTLIIAQQHIEFRFELFDQVLLKQ